jgi:hypothetical protein
LKGARLIIIFTQLRNLFLNLLLLLFVLLLCELALSGISAISPNVDMLTAPPMSPGVLRYYVDPVNGHQGNPRFPEHDEWGYRNSERPEQAEILTIGDSWTYGTIVQKNQTWPVMLSQMINIPIYNMGLGGHGPINYLQTWQKAKLLSPQIVVVAVFIGNDLIVTHNTLNQDLADTIFTDRNEDQRRAILKAEKDNPFGNYALMYQQCGNPDAAKPGDRHWLKTMLRTHSRIYGAYKRLKAEAKRRESAQQSVTPQEVINKDFQRKLNQLTPEQYAYCAPFDDGQWRTVLTQAWRLHSIDPADVRIRAGVHAITHVLETISKEAKSNNTRLLVVMLPTKERVFFSRAAASDATAPALLADLQLIRQREDALKGEIIDYLSRTSINYIDVLGALESAQRQPFLGEHDSHPNEFGNQIIATEVATASQAILRAASKAQAKQ